jgi:hypothetical protein
MHILDRCLLRNPGFSFLPPVHFTSPDSEFDLLSLPTETELDVGVDVWGNMPLFTEGKETEV